MMKQIPLYRFKRDGGGITVSPNKPECQHTEKVRLIAEKGKLLTKDGDNFCRVIDTDTADGWQEVDCPENTEVLNND